MKKYNIIYADPPWKYNNYNYKDAPRGQEKEYNTMTLEEIKNLPIKELADDNCILFMWATFPYLKEGLEVIESWGFEYKTLGFNWVKTNKKSGTLFWGMGNWTRSNSEVCLIGIKGRPKRMSASVHSVVMSELEKHSKKPNIIRDKIVELCGDVPRIELFARNISNGWDVWGNEVNSNIKFE